MSLIDYYQCIDNFFVRFLFVFTHTHSHAWMIKTAYMCRYSTTGVYRNNDPHVVTDMTLILVCRGVLRVDIEHKEARYGEGIYV